MENHQKARQAQGCKNEAFLWGFVDQDSDVDESAAVALGKAAKSLDNAMTDILEGNNVFFESDMDRAEKALKDAAAYIFTVKYAVV